MARTPYVKDLMDSLRQHASNEVRTQVSRALPPGVSLPASVPSNQHGPALALARPNPSRGRVIEAEFEHDEEEQESGGDDHSLFMFFSYPDRERNLASAAAAYRAAGEPPEYDDDDNVVVDGDLIAQHTDLGTAFFGNAAQLQLYIERTDTKPDDWEVWDEPDEILELDFDTDALVRVVRLMDEQQDAFKAAQEEYTKFHWGDRSQGVGMVEIPGVSGPLTALGLCRRVEYGACKQGEWQEYYHEHGEESGTFPTIYGLGPRDLKGHFRAYVVHGGQMRIEDRGIVD